MKFALGLLLLVAACVESGTTECGGLVCPAGTVCAAVTDPVDTLCVVPAALTACDGKQHYDACELPGSDAAHRCYDGVCLVAGCGNGRIDRIDGEVCEDGNQIPGDGCSAECRSDETCGNGVTDPVVSGRPAEQCDDGNLVSHDGCTATCTQEAPRWTRLRTGQPPPRSGHGMTYGIRRERVVMFGGELNDNPLQLPAVYGDTWEWDGVGWIERTPVFTPSARAYAAMTYDSRRDRVVMFGGRILDSTSTTVFDETWEWTGNQWLLAESLTISPLSRARAMLAYDHRRGVTVLFGGYHEGVGLRFGDTWEWDGVSWTERTQTAGSPGPKLESMMAFDPVSGVTVLVTLDSTESTAQMWEYDGTWTQRTPPTLPTPRRSATLTFDPIRGQLILAGGSEAVTGTALGDTWAWTGQDWVELRADGFPKRTSHGAATDLAHKTVLVFGGFAPGTSANTVFGDTLTWSDSPPAWSSKEVRQPAARSAHAAAHDARRGKTVVFGGMAGSGFLDETWELGSSWARRTFAMELPVPAARAGHALAYDAGGGQVVLHGGTVGSGVTDQTWTFDGLAWTQQGGTRPAARTGAAMTYDARRREVVLFGGQVTGGFAADTWIWNGTWVVRTPAAAPPGRSGHVLAFDPIRDRVVLFGGLGLDGSRSDTWEWDGTTWMERLPAHHPIARTSAAMTWSPARQRIVLFGGGLVSGQNTSFNDTWEWDGTDWTRLDVDPAPSPRRLSVMAPTADGLGVAAFGGASGPSTAFDDTWILQWTGTDTVAEICTGAVDADLDGLVGCADPACWAVCTPTCSPGMSCAGAEPTCGDGTADPLETCRLCPADLGACTPVCGDAICDPAEACPGDCP